MSFITFQQPNGQVAVIIPADLSIPIEQIAEKDVPKDEFGNHLPYKIVDNLDIENDYFNAYEFNEESGAEVNIDKAKELHKNKFRTARAPKLEELDIAFMKAVETGDTEKQTEIASEKQILRDITKISLPDTLPELKEVWPEILN
jgi:hypothetical protein